MPPSPSACSPSAPRRTSPPRWSVPIAPRCPHPRSSASAAIRTGATSARPEQHRPGFDDVAWFRMDIGRRQNADPRWILPLICRRGHITKAEVGAIRIGPNETAFRSPVRWRPSSSAPRLARPRATRMSASSRRRPRPGAPGRSATARTAPIRPNRTARGRRAGEDPRRCRRLPGEGRGLQGRPAARGTGGDREQQLVAGAPASAGQPAGGE